MLDAAAVAHGATRIPARCQNRLAPRLCAIHFHHDRTNQYRRQAMLAPLPYRWVAEAHPARRIRILTYWVAAQERALIRARDFPRHAWLVAALCIHSHEGSWTDTSPPYMGGMQFDEQTWTSNGGVGNPGAASVATQLAVAYRTWLHRGWEPWPSTRVMCGV